MARGDVSSSLTAADVVCTASAEREARLLACVGSLLAGTRIPEEVLVVVDGNRALKESVAAWLPPSAQWLRMERRGNSAARNMGLRAAVARLAGNAIPRLLSGAQRRGSPRSSGVAL
jgi:hypothetical protein